MSSFDIQKEDESDDYLLKIKNLKKYFILNNTFLNLFQKKRKIVRAVDDVTFNVKRGEVLVLAGESGSGKTTLARLIMKAIEPDYGRIIFDGCDITKINKKNILHYRSQIHMIHQDPYSSLNPRLKIIDSLLEPLNIHEKKLSKDKKIEACLNTLKEVELEPFEEIAEKYPHMLSGGQRQRVGFARALVLKPKMILADEPVSMLDTHIRFQILSLMDDLRKKHNISFLYITHDLLTSNVIGNNIALMYKGQIVEYGNLSKILKNPLHPYTQALIDAISQFNPDNLKKTKEIKIVDRSTIDTAEGGCIFYNKCIFAMDNCKNPPTFIKRSHDQQVKCFLYENNAIN